MYNSANVSERIKSLAKDRGISMKKLLLDVGLGFNTMSNMKTSMPKADNLAKIADYLGCSVDYLLGRTDNPENTNSTNINVIKIAGRDGSFQEHQLNDEQLAALKAIIAQMPDASDDL